MLLLSALLLGLANGYSGTCRTIDSSRWTTGLTAVWGGAEMAQLAIDFDNDNKFEDFVLNDETYILVHFLVGVDHLTLNPFYPINPECGPGTPTGLENANGCLDCVCLSCSCGYGFTEQKVLYMEVDDDESGRDVYSGSPYEYFEFQLLNKAVAWFYIDTVTFVEVCQGISPTVTGTTATNSPSDIAPVDDIIAELNPGYHQGNVHSLAIWRRTSTLHFAIEGYTPVRENDYVLVSFDGEISMQSFWSPFKEAIQVGDTVNENVWLFRFDADYGNEENWYGNIHLNFIGSNWHRPAVQWVCVVEDPSNKGDTTTTATTTTSTTTTTTTSTSTTTTPTTTEEQTTTTVDPCPCTAEVRDAMNTNEPILSKWSMYKVVFQGDTMDYFQFASAAVVGKQSYQQYYIMSQKACTVAGLEGFRDENFRAYFLDLHNAEAHDLTTPMTNYQSFNSVYYRNNAGEAGKHKSVTFGFRADKTKTDVTGNHKQDKMMVALQNNMDFDLLYDCLGTAKPVTIDTDAAGVIPTCDYAKCVGQEIMVGW